MKDELTIVFIRADFGVGLGMYIELKSNILNGGAGDVGNAIRIGDAKWVPERI